MVFVDLAEPVALGHCVVAAEHIHPQVWLSMITEMHNELFACEVCGHEVAPTLMPHLELKLHLSSSLGAFVEPGDDIVGTAPFEYVHPQLVHLDSGKDVLPGSVPIYVVH